MDLHNRTASSCSNVVSDKTQFGPSDALSGPFRRFATLVWAKSFNLINADCGEMDFQKRGAPQLMSAESVQLSVNATTQDSDGGVL